MELSDVFGAVRRGWSIVLVSIVVAIGCWAAVTVRPGLPVTASVEGLVVPTPPASDSSLGDVLARSATIPHVVASQEFHDAVAAKVASEAAPAAVELRAITNPQTGSLVITARGTDAGNNLVWANAAASLTARGAGGGPGAAVDILGPAAMNPRSGEKANLVACMALGAILGAMVAIGLEGLRSTSPARRLRRRYGVPVLAQLPFIEDFIDLSPKVVFRGEDESLADLREAFERAYVQLAVRLAGASDRRVAVVTGSPGEGRTTVEDHLAWLADSAPAPASRTGLGPAFSSSPAIVRPGSDVMRADRAVIVVDFRRHQLRKLEGTISGLRSAGVEIVGVILNKTPERADHSPAEGCGPWRRDGAEGPSPVITRPSGSGLPPRLLRNSLGTYGAVILAGVSALIVTPVVVHHLGKSAFGVYSLLAQTSGYLILLNLGFGTSTVKLIAEDAGRRTERVIETFNTSFFALCVLGAVAAVAGVVAGLLLPALFKIPASLHHDAIISFELMALAFAASIPATAIVGVVMGYQRYDLQGAVDMIGIVGLGISTVAVAVWTSNLVAVALVTASGTVLINAVQWVVAKRLVPGLRIMSPRRLDRGRFRRTTSLSGWYLLQELSATLNTETDLLVVGALLGVRDVALFAIGLQLAQLGDKAVSPFQRVFFPHVSAMSVDDGSADELRGVFVDGTRAVLAIATPVCLSLMLLAGPAVRAWVGASFSGAAKVMVVLAGVSLAQSIATVPTQILVGLGRARSGSYIGVATAVVNLICSVLLGRIWGITGVALGSLLAVGLVFVPATLIVTARLLEASLLEWIRQGLLPNLLPAAGAIGCLLAVRYHGGSSPVVVIGGGLASWLVSGVIYLAVSATEDERAHIGLLAQGLAAKVRSASLGDDER